MSPPGAAEPLVNKAVDQDPAGYQGLQLLFYRAAQPLSRQTLTYLAGIIGRHQKVIDSCWRKLDPGERFGKLHLRHGKGAHG